MLVGFLALRRAYFEMVVADISGRDSDRNCNEAGDGDRRWEIYENVGHLAIALHIQDVLWISGQPGVADTLRQQHIENFFPASSRRKMKCVPKSDSKPIL